MLTKIVKYDIKIRSLDGALIAGLFFLTDYSAADDHHTPSTRTQASIPVVILATDLRQTRPYWPPTCLGRRCPHTWPHQSRPMVGTHRNWLLTWRPHEARAFELYEFEKVLLLDLDMLLVDRLDDVFSHPATDILAPNATLARLDEGPLPSRYMVSAQIITNDTTHGYPPVGSPLLLRRLLPLPSECRECEILWIFIADSWPLSRGAPGIRYAKLCAQEGCADAVAGFRLSMDDDVAEYCGVQEGSEESAWEFEMSVREVLINQGVLKSKLSCSFFMCSLLRNHRFKISPRNWAGLLELMDWLERMWAVGISPPWLNAHFKSNIPPLIDEHHANNFTNVPPTVLLSLPCVHHPMSEHLTNLHRFSSSLSSPCLPSFSSFFTPIVPLLRKYSFKYVSRPWKLLEAGGASALRLSFFLSTSFLAETECSQNLYRLKGELWPRTHPIADAFGGLDLND